MFGNLRFTTSWLVCIWALIGLSYIVTSATVEQFDKKMAPVECSIRWSTEDEYRDQYSVSCDGEKKNVCDVRTCHMGGEDGDPDNYAVNKQLFLDGCIELASNGHKPIRIFPRTYNVTEDKIFAHGFSPSDAEYKMANYQCPSSLNNRRVWCNSCSTAKPSQDQI